MHGTYLHSSSHSMAEGDRKADMVLQPTKTGFIFEKKGQSGVNFDWVELGNSGTCWMRLSIPYKKRFGPGGHFFIVGMVVPEDNDNCRVFFWRIRRVQGWQRDMWRFMLPQPSGKTALGSAGAGPRGAGKPGAKRARS